MSQVSLEEEEILEILEEILWTKHLFAAIRNLFYWSEWRKCGKSSFLTDSFFLFLMPCGNVGTTKANTWEIFELKVSSRINYI